MTKDKNSAREALDRLTDALVDSILNASTEDTLEEFRDTHGDPEQNAVEMRAIFEKAVLAVNRQRLVKAQAGVATDHSRSREGGTVINYEKERRRLRSLLDRPDIAERLTLAARKESELSDNDVVNMLNNLRELGISSADDDDNGMP